jgi:hypothetical protein
MTKRKIEYWVIPPEADGEFVAHMEEVLETYEKAYDPDCPVVCMDEQPVQLSLLAANSAATSADSGGRMMKAGRLGRAILCQLQGREWAP